MKKPDNYLKEFCRLLSEENLKKLHLWLNRKLSDDLTEALNYMGQTKEMDKWFASASSANELYDMIDSVTEVVNKEYKKRYEGVAA